MNEHNTNIYHVKPEKYVLFLLVSFLLFIASSLSAQTDTEFWFVAPEVTWQHDNGRYYDEWGTNYAGGEPILLRFTTLDLPATITITQPANAANFPPITLNLPANSNHTVNLTDMGLQNEVENDFDDSYEPGTPGKSNKGIRITSTSLITAYYEVRTRNNPDIFSLKGRNALGSEFYVPFQTNSTNQKNGWTTKANHAADIVAIEDNTEIEITPGKAAFPGRPAGVPFTITLDRGETFSLLPDWHAADNWWDRRAANHMTGTHITVKDGKKVAVTIKDDSMKHPTRGCYDLVGDQLVPLDILGLEYIAMRGQLFDPLENLFIVATEDNTSIWFQGNAGAPDQILNQYEDHEYQVPSGTDIVHVRADKKIIVLHISGFGCEMGGAILPPTDKCTGSGRVGFTRSTAGDGEEFFMNIMVRNGAEDNFLFNGAAPTFFDETDFVNIPGTTDWLAARIGPVAAGTIPRNTPQLLSNTEDVFHLGIINGSTNGGTRFGYFSDFNEVKAASFTVESGSPFYYGCAGESIQLVARGGTRYEWSPPTYLNDPYSSSPIATPPGSMSYKVVISGACNLKDSATVTVGLSYPVQADFDISQAQGCAPKEITINARFKGVKEMRWDFGNGTENWVFPDTTSFDTTFTRTYQNETDTTQTFPITLSVFNKQDCIDEKTRYITVQPRITADFDKTPADGCAPVPVQFTNTSSGDLGTYKWEFGDNNSSTQTNPLHSFNNESRQDTTYSIMLVATSPFLCRDTAYSTVTVNPWIETGFAIDSVFACAQYEATIHNTSNHADFFHLDFGDGTDTTLTEGWTSISHRYNNNSTLPITYTITLAGDNVEGCSDTMTRKVSVYPEVTADFTIDKKTGCDSTRIQTNNLSAGHNMSYKWELGDGASSTSFAPQHRYYNKTNDSINYSITLVVESNYFCQDTHQVTFTSYPYIEARFAIDTTQGCPPFPVTIHNTSIGTDNYSWDFGDGNSSTSAATTLHHNYQNSSFTKDSTHTVELIASNRFACTDTSELDITVYKNITASFTPDTNASCSPGLFKFVSTSQGASAFFWNFDDGGTSVQEDSAGHTYPINNDDTTQVYQVGLLVVSDNNKCISVADTTIYVHPYIKALFSVETFIDCPPFEANFENASIGTNNAYRWFIDGVQDMAAPATKTNYSNTFNNPNPSNLVYEIRLEAENPQGCLSEHIDSVAAYPEITAQFSFLPDTGGCSPFPVNFTNTSLNANEYEWRFGNHASSVIKHPNHIFYNYHKTQDTSYLVEMIAKSANCSDTTSRIFAVYAVPLADFSTDKHSDCPPFDVQINNTSLSTDALFHWDFGDGQEETNTDSALTHTYNNTDSLTASYRLRLHVETTSGCHDSIATQVQVYPQVIADFSYDSAGCSRFASQFTNLSINAHQYAWDFDNGEYSSSISPKHHFTNISDSNQHFSVFMRATSEFDCKDSISRTVTVHPTPNTRFMANPTLMIYYSNPQPIVQLENQTPHRATWNYIWSFGDGMTDTSSAALINKTYTYWAPRSNDYRFIINLIASNPEHPDCSDTTNNVIIIRPPVPTGEIVSPDSAGCEPLTIDFDVLTEYEDSVIWDFHDGNSSTARSPEHTFDEAGFYNVKLTVYGDGGVNYDYKTIVVHKTPLVDFAVDPRIVQLPNADIHCFNQSRYGESYLWRFGDGHTSEQEMPWHSYASVGEKSITLVVTSEEGCKDSLTKENIILVEAPGVVQFPNAFKPNQAGSSGGKYSPGDVGSAIFRPLWEGVDENEYLFQIFNRWGEQIFETTHIWTGWDGYYKGKLSKQDVYIWKVKGKFLNGTTFEKTGTVTLLR